ncbi:hypothetical protein [Alteromonas macleodii]|uniref:Uncharacterized protein n=1 Tax=Alteromonas macleodii TaxID=28108 RepID=A0AB36FMZ9_ALTMA|nr:hypothetical protein [Alteromonas macleodii]OES24491.1 hypothetical protein BFV95_4758 [Alteromonas macleodii]OES25548.1 hypothetical protein BFV94_4401 [Alteromonas macleodii]OES25849.1 hypothetical protein BFV93_4312 [Alteromonas macleodii]OES38629.1 hypothetical protein BFV96_4740 [Alteromonas macleodii]
MQDNNIQPRFTQVPLPHRQAKLIVDSASIPERAAMVIQGLAKGHYHDATDLACAVNLLPDIDDIAECSDLDIDFALSVVLNNYDGLLDSEERDELIEQYEVDGYHVGYDTDKALWYPTTYNAAIATMVVVQ